MASINQQHLMLTSNYLRWIFRVKDGLRFLQPNHRHKC